jgi:hypothetical protein
MSTTVCITKTEKKKICIFLRVFGVSEILRMNSSILLQSIKQSGLEMEREYVLFEVKTKFLITI